MSSLKSLHLIKHCMCPFSNYSYTLLALRAPSSGGRHDVQLVCGQCGGSRGARAWGAACQCEPAGRHGRGLLQRQRPSELCGLLLRHLGCCLLLRQY